MNVKNQNNKQQGSHWLRAGLLTFTLAGPVVNAVAERIRERMRRLGVQATALQDNAQTIQASARQRLDQLALESRQRFAEQTKQLQQLQAQAKRLRKTLRKNVKRRRKLVRKLRRSSADWSQAMFLSSAGVAGDLADRAKQVWEASNRLTQDLVKRGGKLSDELTERGSKFAQGLGARSEQLLQPSRKRNRNLWTIIGFGIGLVVAGVTTYLFVRRRVVQQELEESLPIELPQSGNRNGARDATQGPQERNVAGEILLVVDEDNGTAVVTLPVAEVEKMQRPADAAFVGVTSTRFYYPAETPLEEKDLVYFSSEEEARKQGFTAAQ